MYVWLDAPARRANVAQFAPFNMEQETEALIAVNHAQGGRTYYVKENPSTIGERIAYVRSIHLAMTRLQLAEEVDL